MFLRSLFRVTKPKRHKYIPRYYNEEKEALEKRLSRIERLKDNDPEAIKEGIKQAFGKSAGAINYREAMRLRQKESRRSNLVIFAVLIVLIVVTFFMLNIYTFDIQN